MQDNNRTFSDGINEGMDNSISNTSNLRISEQSLYGEFVKNFTELKGFPRDYEMVRVSDLAPGNTLDEKIKIYLKEAEVKHFERRNHLIDSIKDSWKDSEYLKNNNYHDIEYNKKLLEFLQKQDAWYYELREKMEKDFPQERDPGLGFDSVKIYKNIQDGLSIRNLPNKTIREQIDEMLDKLKDESSEMGLSEEQREVLMKSNAGKLAKYLGKPALKKYMSPPDYVALILKKIGARLNIPEEQVIELIEKVETPAGEKKLTDIQKAAIREFKGGKYLEYLGKDSMLEYKDIPPEALNIVKSLQLTLKRSGLEKKETEVIELINRLQDEYTAQTLDSNIREILKRGGGGRYLELMGKPFIKGYAGLPKEISNVIVEIGKKLNLSERDVYKKLTEMENDRTAENMMPDEVKVLQDLNAKKYLDFMGKPVALKFMGIPENVYKDLMIAKKILRVETTRDFLKLVNKLKDQSTAEDLSETEQEVFKQYAVANYLKLTGKSYVKEYAGLPLEIENIIHRLVTIMGIPERDVYKKINKLQDEEKLLGLTAKEKQILAKEKAGLYLKYMKKNVVPGFSGTNIVEIDPIKLLKDVATELNVDLDRALYYIMQLETPRKEARLDKNIKKVLAHLEAGKWLLADHKSVVAGYVGIDKGKETSVLKMWANLMSRLDLDDKGVQEILENLGSKEYVDRLRPQTVRILKEENAGMFLRLKGKRPVIGFEEAIDPEKLESSYKNVIPLGSFYHPSVGWY